MKVYKKQTSTETIPYLDNCYIGVKINDTDVDVTTVFSLYEFFRVSQIDYIQFREYCKTYILPNWISLSIEEQKELVRHNIAPTNEDKLLHFTIEKQFENYVNLVDLEIKARKVRWSLAMKSAAFELLGDQLAQLQMYNDAKPFRDDYIEADLPFLLLWITDGAYPALGIDFSANGFSTKSYYSETIKNKVVSILVNNTII